MATASVIGRETVVRGNVRGDGSLEIHGRVEGDVTVDGDVVVSEEGSVRGNVTGAQLSVAGAVQGDLHGSESVLVERGARVLGDLTGPRIGVAPGALVKGNVRTDGEPPLEQPQRRATVAQPPRAAVSKVAVLPIKPPVAAAPPAASPAAIKQEEQEPPKREKAEAPPPVVPALGKHAKAKKKRRDG
jgi:cytoskeletal protein CcmA (bactofilin family)